MSYQKKTPTYEKFILDPTNPTWLDDFNGWLDGLYSDVELLEDAERGGAQTGFFQARTISEGDRYYPIMAWGDQPWIVMHNNVDKSLAQMTQQEFDTYYESV